MEERDGLALRVGGEPVQWLGRLVTLQRVVVERAVERLSGVATPPPRQRREFHLIHSDVEKSPRVRRATPREAHVHDPPAETDVAVSRQATLANSPAAMENAPQATTSDAVSVDVETEGNASGNP